MGLSPVVGLGSMNSEIPTCTAIKNQMLNHLNYPGPKFHVLIQGNIDMSGVHGGTSPLSDWACVSREEGMWPGGEAGSSTLALHLSFPSDSGTGAACLILP